MAAQTRHLGRKMYPKRTWLTDTYIRKVHKDMFTDIWTWAGAYRTIDVQPGIPFHRIATEVGLLCQDVGSWNKHIENPIPILERAARLHHRLVQIHPFRNGNGRHARLMADILLRSHGHPLPDRPHSEMMQEGPSPRTEYVRALKTADQGDCQSLIAYTQQYIH